MNNAELKTYIVPCYYQVYAPVKIKAHSFAEAIAIFCDDESIPAGEICEDTFEVDMESDLYYEQREADGCKCPEGSMEAEDCKYCNIGYTYHYDKKSGRCVMREDKEG